MLRGPTNRSISSAWARVPSAWSGSAAGGDQAADTIDHEWQAVLAVGVGHEVRGDKNL